MVQVLPGTVLDVILRLRQQIAFLGLFNEYVHQEVLSSAELRFRERYDLVVFVQILRENENVLFDEEEKSSVTRSSLPTSAR